MGFGPGVCRPGFFDRFEGVENFCPFCKALDECAVISNCSVENFQFRASRRRRHIEDAADLFRVRPNAGGGDEMSEVRERWRADVALRRFNGESIVGDPLENEGEVV